MRCVLFAVLAALMNAGCGESAAQKRNRTVSQIEVLAEKLGRDVGDDGWFRHYAGDDADAWGQPLDVRYKRADGSETVTVWSNGPDGLPRTRDDVASHSYGVVNALAAAEIAAMKAEAARLRAEGRREAVEEYGQRLTKGLVKGVRQGWRDREK